MKTFFYGIVFAAIFQLIFMSPTINVMYLWAAMSIGVVVGSAIFWFSSAVDYEPPMSAKPQEE